MTLPRKRTAILISGRGSNMAALIAAAAEPGFPAEIVGVLSDRSDAPGLQAAQSLGVTARAVPRQDRDTNEAHERALDAALSRLKAELICLAGYMRVLSPGFVQKWQGRLINMHPALLPAFPGLDTHRRALEAGLRVHGATVHFVTAAVDDGPIIAQAAVPVLIGDGEAALAERVLRAEHKLYPIALALLAGGKVMMKDGRAVFEGETLLENGGTTLISPASWAGPSDLQDLARITP